MLQSKSLLFLVCGIGCALGVPAPGQCSTVVSAAAPRPDLSYSTNCATVWDADGAGPGADSLVVGGALLVGGSGPAQRRVMRWDGTQWLPFADDPGAGVGGTVTALTVWNDQLIAGGSFVDGGADHVATWNGAVWQPLGAGLPSPVRLLATYNGLLIAATSETGGQQLWSWDGTAWTSLPLPPLLEVGKAITVYQGLLCVAGYRITQSVGVLERWDGTNWLPPTVADAEISCLGVRLSLAVGGTDILYAGGAFTSIGGVSAARVARTSGGFAFAWSQVATGVPAWCIALYVRTSGLNGTTLFVSTWNTPTPTLQLNSAGTAFVAAGTRRLYSMIRYAGSVHGLGDLKEACLRYDGTDWRSVRGPGVDGEVLAASRLAGDMVVGGRFASVSGVTTNNVARWDGTTFSPLGAGLSGTSVDALLTLDNGDVIAGGAFTGSGATAAPHVARWDGSAWSPVGQDLGGQVLALAQMPNGDVIAGGRFTAALGAPSDRIARWNGTAWAPLGSGMNGDVETLAVRADGTLFAGGTFTTAGGVLCPRIAQWNGIAWQPLATGCDAAVHAIAARPNGDIVAVGAFTTAGGVAVNRCALWTGASWTSMNALSPDVEDPRAVAVLPNGDVVAGRGFHHAAVHDDGLSRWDGTVWNGSVLLDNYTANAGVRVRTIALRANGDLLVGGDFAFTRDTLPSQPQVAGGLAMLSPTCAAAAQSYGSGCSSAAGPIVLTADTLPWIGATFRTTTTGIAANALCAGLIGFTQLSIPLDTLLPEGQPGCTLLTSPDAIVPLVAGPGTAHLVLPFANDPALIGAAFQHQTIPIEFDPFGAILAFRASNALALVMGAL